MKPKAFFAKMTVNRPCKFVIELQSGVKIAAMSQQEAIQGVKQYGAKWPEDVKTKDPA